MKCTVQYTRRLAMLLALGCGLVVRTPLAAEPVKPTVRALRQPAYKVAKLTRAVMQAVYQAGERLVALGERGLVIFSDDAGQSWTQADVPVSCTLNAARFVDARHGWAVGSMGVVLETTDGGATWVKRLDGQQAADLVLKAARAQLASSQQATVVADSMRLVEDAERMVAEGPDKPLLDLGVAPDGSLLVVGAYGLALSLSAGGSAWQSYMQHVPNPDGLTLYGAVNRGDEGWLYGEQGILLRSAGLGKAYMPQVSPSGGSLFGALVLRNGIMLLMGLRGKVWRSTAVGEVWQAVQTPVDAALLAGVQLADGSVLLVGAAGQVLLSRDGGEHFRPLSLPQRFPFNGVTQAADGGVVLVGMRGVLRLSLAELKAAANSGSHQTSKHKAS